MYPFLSRKMLISSMALSLALGGTLLLNADRAAAAPAYESGATGKHHQRCSSVVNDAASVIGIPPSQLQNILSQGKSIADAAKEKGISESELTAKLVAVRSGKLESKINDLIRQKGTPDAFKDPLAHHHHSLLRLIGTDKLSAVIGVPKEELLQQLKSGKSLTEIAQTRGIGKKDLVNKLKEQLNPVLEKEIEHKAAQAPAKK